MRIIGPITDEARGYVCEFHARHHRGDSALIQHRLPREPVRNSGKGFGCLGECVEPLKIFDVASCRRGQDNAG